MHSHPLVAQLEALQQAEQFVAGFEDDAAQQPAVTDLLAKLRTQIHVTLIALDTLRVTAASTVAEDWLNPTEAEIARFKARLQAKEEAKRQRMAVLPPGTCPECEGEGTLYSALHMFECPECNGTGKATGLQGGAA